MEGVARGIVEERGKFKGAEANEKQFSGEIKETERMKTSIKGT